MVGIKMRHRTKISNAANLSSWDTVPNLVCTAIMYILSAAFTLSFLRHRETFGSYPECNGAARLFFFATLKVSHGWFIVMAIFYGFFLSVILFLILKVIYFSIGFSIMRKAVKMEKYRKMKEHQEMDEHQKMEEQQEMEEQRTRGDKFVCFIFVLIPAFSTCLTKPSSLHSGRNRPHRSPTSKLTFAGAPMYPSFSSCGSPSQSLRWP
jgi:uncharacterized membrane protein